MHVTEEAVVAEPRAPNGSHEAVSPAQRDKSPQQQEVRYLHKKFKKAAEAAEELDGHVQGQAQGQGQAAEEAAGRYACPYCRLACAKPSVLQKHVRAHTGERPFPCRPCGFAFKTRSNLYKHCRSRAHSLRLEEGGAGAGAHPQPAQPPESPPTSPAASAASASAASGSASGEGDGDGDSADDYADADSRDSRPAPGSQVHAEGGESEASASPSPALSLSSVGSTSCGSTVVTSATSLSQSPLQQQQQQQHSQQPARHIYKPKFHKAVLYQQQQDEAPLPATINEASSSPLSSQSVQQEQQQQEQQLATSSANVQNPLPPPPLVCHGTAGSPSPEVITRHITNIITHNQQVVSCSWPKKMHLHRQQMQQQPDHSSRLAAALLRPSRTETTPSPRPSEGSSACSTPEPVNATLVQQPLNLSSRPVPVLAQEPAPGVEAPQRLKTVGQIPPLVQQHAVSQILRDHNHGCGPPIDPGPDSSAALALLNDLASATSKEHTAENSIIKRLLLKRRAAEAAAAAAAAAEVGATLEPTSQLADDLPTSSVTTASFQFVCNVCKIQFRSAENLETHQHYYCTRRPRISSASSYSSLEETRHQRTALKVDVRAAVASGDRVAPPFPSPGPLLGSTPLIDSYRPEDKRRRLDSERSSSASSSCCTSPLPSLRSIEELSKCPPPAPPRPNSLQMFGGEVQILDAAGEMKTLRIEPSTRGSGHSPGLTVGHMGGGLVVGPCSTTASVIEGGQPQSPHIVVTIARSGLHSGGTLVQLPTTTISSGVAGVAAATMTPTPAGGSSANGARTPRTSGGGVVSPKPTQNTPSTVPAAASAPAMFPAARLVTPNIATPDLAVPGIPPPGRPLPFPVAFPAFLNPLTHITAYNPLTLPPPSVASGTSGTTGVVTIQYGGKVIPHVPGIPGPQTLLLRNTAPLDLAVTSGVVQAPPTTVVDSPCMSPQVSKAPVKCSTTGLITVSAPSKRETRDDTVRLPSASSSPPKKMPKLQSTLPMIKVDCASSPGEVTVERLVSEDSVKRLSPSKPVAITPPPRKVSRGSDSIVMGSKCESSLSPAKPENGGRTESADIEKNIENEDGNGRSGNSDSSHRPRFLRPTSLPLKPGTFTPKKVHGMGLTPVLPLVSPETPRPKKSYGQLYLNGHAYTYLGLKCSARSYYCTLNRLQPMYVLHSPEHSKLSMYSNWKVCSEAAPNPLGLEPGKAMALYDSRHRPVVYTVARTSQKHALVMTHSSYWQNKTLNQMKNKEKKDVTDEGTSEDKTNADDGENSSENNTNGQEGPQSGEQPPRRVKIFDGGFESNEEYTYVRGRGRGRYVCEECGIRCKKPSMLKKHIRTHTDVRPFTCKHCNFSFKTKGNLTKHMKSKAHYKKCVELGIVPVPTVVDDSYIDEECLAKQQAMRASRIEDGESESDDNDEDEDDDDDEDEDEDDEQVPADEDCDDEANKGAPEREAARSLLSLSRGGGSSSPGLASAGLVPAVAARPNTYPYMATIIVPTPHTPTLSAVSAQTEREKVSNNTGLALGLEGTTGGGLVVQSTTNRYYFPSNRTTTTTSTPQPALSVSSPTTSTVPLVTTRDKDGLPVDLSTRSQLQLHVQTQPTTPVSEILTPVSEPATLLASLCSSAERCPPPPAPPVPAPAEATMLQAYLTERALQDARVKRHQVLQPEPTPPVTDVAGNCSTPTASFPTPVSRTETCLSVEVTFSAVSSVAACVSSSIPISVAQSSSMHVELTAPNGSPARSSPFSSQRPLSPPTTQITTTRESPTQSPGGPKAEFMPPSSGPSPSYVSITDDGRSMCSICNKIFSKPSQLRLHVNIHYFERPFRCESCAVSFRTKGHLQKHERSVSHQNKVSMNSTFGAPTTTNPRPFKCDDCKIAFRIHGHLAKHLRSKMHIMKLECVGKLPFGTYAEMEREGISLNEIDTTDCENSLESLQVLAQKLYEKDPSKLGQWDGERGLLFLPNSHSQLSGGETSSDEGEPLIGYQSPHYPEATPSAPAVSNVNHELINVSTNQQHRSKNDQLFTRHAKVNSQISYNNVSAANVVETKYDDLAPSLYSRSHINKTGKERAIQSRAQLNVHTAEVSKEYFKIVESCQNNSLHMGNSVHHAEKTSMELQQKEPFRQMRNSCAQIASFDIRPEQQNEKEKSVCRTFSEIVSKEAGVADATSKSDNDGLINQTIFLCKMCKKTFSNKNDLQVHNFISHESNHNSQRCSPLTMTAVNENLSRTSPASSLRNCNVLFSATGDSNLSDGSQNVLGTEQMGTTCVDTNEQSTLISHNSDSFGTSSPLATIYNTQGQFLKLCKTGDGENRSMPKDYNSQNIRRLDENRTVLTPHNVRGSSVKESCSDSYSGSNLKESESYGLKMSTTNRGEASSEVRNESGEVNVRWTESRTIYEHLKVTQDNCGIQCQNNETSMDCGYNFSESAISSSCVMQKDKVNSKSRLLSNETVESSVSANNVDKTLCCDLCGKLHSSRESLQKHILSHTQIRPFVCEFCDAGFTSQHLLNGHLEMHKKATAHL
ncbi:uncharacterized protein LOC126253464 [Schistocerca nitens]|uniref:uncharacterized protein LOC126253464 n=1 Tax=Schistocerca nitens TaxID=7011 RepID=UPI0021174CBF|nr:uncharacterized protein LOC126253464 [Schistocerca nitens]